MDGVLRQALPDFGLLHAGAHGIVKRAIGRDIAGERFVRDRHLAQLQREFLLPAQRLLELALGDLRRVERGVHRLRGLEDRAFQPGLEFREFARRLDEFRMLGFVTAAQRRHLGFLFADLAPQFADFLRARDAREREQCFRGLPRHDLNLRSVGFELEPLRFGGGDFGAEFLQPLDDDVLLFLQRHGAVLLLVLLERLLGFREARLQPLRFVAQIFVGRLGNLDAPFRAPAEKFIDEQSRELLRHRGAFILDRHVDELGAAPDARGDFIGERGAQPFIRSGTRHAREKRRVVRDLGVMDEAQDERGAEEILLDGLEHFVAGALPGDPRIELHQALLLALDLHGDGRLVELGKAGRVEKSRRRADGDDRGDDPRLFQKQMPHGAEVRGQGDHRPVVGVRGHGCDYLFPERQKPVRPRRGRTSNIEHRTVNVEVRNTLGTADPTSMFNVRCSMFDVCFM